MVLISDPETLSMQCPSVSLSCVFTCVIWFQKAEMVMAKMLQKPAITMLLTLQWLLPSLYSVFGYTVLKGQFIYVQCTKNIFTYVSSEF